MAPLIKFVPPPGLKKQLFAVAYNTLSGGQWIPGGIEHLHAYTVDHARVIFLHSRPKRSIQIIGVSALVGYFVEDEKKLILSAT